MPGVNFAVLREQLAMWAAARGVSLHAAAIELCKSFGMDVPWIKRA